MLVQSDYKAVRNSTGVQNPALRPLSMTTSTKWPESTSIAYLKPLFEVCQGKQWHSLTGCLDCFLLLLALWLNGCCSHRLPEREDCRLASL